MAIRIDTHGTTLRICDGRKVLTRIETALTQAALDGIVAGADTGLPLDALEQSLRDAVEETAKRRGSVVPFDYRLRYGADQTCGDDVAKALTAKVTTPTGVDLDALREVAAANGAEDRLDGWLVKGLNPGMLRMNLGNVLRGMARRGEEVRGL